MDAVLLKIRRSRPADGRPAPYLDCRVPLQDKMTVLDAVAWVERNHAHDLAYRYSCRVGMCGTCALVINGREAWACRTLIESLRTEVVTVEPLRNLPVIKDLVVDMQPFFDAMLEAAAYFVADEADGSGQGSEQPRARPDLAPAPDERQGIDSHIECITCGACYSACTMLHWDPSYLGPAALNRAATLVMDSRDGAREARLAGVGDEHGCWRCHSQFSCTDVCPMQLRPTESIGYLKRRLVARSIKRLVSPAPPEAAPETSLPVVTATPPAVEAPPVDTRRRFLGYAIAGIFSTIAASLGGAAAGYLRGPSVGAGPGPWVSLGSIRDFQPDVPTEVVCRFPSVAAGRADVRQRRVYVLRPTNGRVLVLSTECPHLGCGVHWDSAIRQYVCPCHGGTFDVEGRVLAGPPPRPLGRYSLKVEQDELLIQET